MPTSKNLDIQDRNRLVEENRGLVWHTVRQLPEDVVARLGGPEDAAQTGYLAMLRAVERYDSELGTKFSTFACTCIRRALVNDARKSRNRPTRSLFDAEGQCRNFPAPADPDPFLSEEVHAALNRLRPEDKELIECRHFGGKSLAQMSAQLGVSVERVRQKLLRATRRLRAVIDGIATADDVALATRPAFGGESSVVDDLAAEKLEPVLPSLPGPIAEASPDMPSCHRVLLIDDNQDAADTLRFVLELFGFEIRVAYSGIDGLEIAAVWHPDAVVSDIGLPELDGYEVARRLCHCRTVQAMRLIALTAYGTDRDRERGREAGFDHYLVKPVDPTDVMRLLAPDNVGAVTSPDRLGSRQGTTVFV